MNTRDVIQDIVKHTAGPAGFTAVKLTSSDTETTLDVSYLDLRFEFGEHCKSTGFTLCESRMAPDLTITPHIDYARSACLTFPLTFPQVVQFYDGDDVVYEYQYQNQTAVLGNIGSIKHGVTYAPDIRRQFQLDIFNTWDEISEINSIKELTSKALYVIIVK